jgi:uncharacterized membrane protein YczE
MINQTILTDALERELAARQADRISRPIDLRRLVRTWGRARRAARRSLPHDQPASRLAQLTLGLLVYGISEALMLAPSVGVDPWDVFHTGLSRITGIPVGTVLILIGGVVLLLWIPLRQVPGVGTVANIFVIGVVIDLLLGVMPVPHAFLLRWAEYVAGVLLNAVATGLYIGAGLGAGPRDGLTTGLGRRGRSIRVVRTGIELSVLAAGWLLGGNVGAGTVVYAVGIGPLVHVTIPWFARERGRTPVRAQSRAAITP